VPHVPARVPILPPEKEDEKRTRNPNTPTPTQHSTMMVVTVNPVSVQKPMGVTRLQKLVAILMVLAIVNLAAGQRRIFQQEIACSTTGTHKRAVDFRLADLPHLDEWKDTLCQRLDPILQDCGSLCQNSFSRQAWLENSVPVEGANLRLTHAPDVDCRALMTNSNIDAGDTTIPYPLPEELVKYYSVDNAVMIRNQKRYQKVYVDGDAEANVWTQQMIEEMVQPLKSKCF